MIKVNDRVVERALRDVDAILIIGGRVKIASNLAPVLSKMNIPLAIMAADSVSLLINPIGTLYNNYRKLQYLLSKTRALSIALDYIKAKIVGMKNILNYHKFRIPGIPASPEFMDDEVEYETAIRTWESTSSGLLWSHLINLIKPDVLKELERKYAFRGRKPKHPDPFNKTLSVMYAVIYSLATKALIAAGLDPTYGFLHRTRYSTPLTFDYTEMFKPVAIHATMDLVNSQGLPRMDDDGELTRESINMAIKKLYEYLTLKHKDTRKSIYQQIFSKAFCLAKYLEGRCRRDRLTLTYDRRVYRKPKS